MMRFVLLGVVTATVALLASGCGGSGHREHQTATARRTLTDLHSISQLRRAFDSASGEPRLIVLVSPT